jgi:mono/diheme cytochrome c family protein
MLRKPLHALLPAVMLLPAFGPAAPVGGWAVITVEDLPEYLTAGEPTRLEFTVRQHGMRPLTDLEPRVEASSGSMRTNVDVKARFVSGRYTAIITPPKSGDWTVTIHSGFMSSRVTLLPIRVVDPGARVPSVPEREQGRALFVAKGCVTCHVHEEAKAELSTAVGPELTGRRYPADYLKRFLANPAIAVAQRPATWQMPNLGLKPREIDALVTFVNTDRQVSARR